MFVMDFQVKQLFALIALINVCFCAGEHEEDIPYENVRNICKTCICQSQVDELHHNHNTLSCIGKNFQHILPRWPEEFGSDHADLYMTAVFSHNSIHLLQQLPATNASLTFICQNCGISSFQVPTFMDVPNIQVLDLSYNNITNDKLTPDVFRGPYHTNRYEPIALIEIDLSFNRLRALDEKLFEHTPFLKKLILSHNKLTKLDVSTTLALESITNLEHLDLSFTGLHEISSTLFTALYNLKTLNLAGNEFSVFPERLQLIGKSLETLNLAANKFKQFSETNFLGLKSLRHLNISYLPALKTVENDTFTHLETLEFLHVSHNSMLEQFDLSSLMHCTKLIWLDISYNSLSTVSLQVDFLNASAAFPRPWTNLKKFLYAGNRWLCDCDLLQTFELIGVQHLQQDEHARCMEPFQLSGALVSNLTSAQICAMHLPPRFRVINDEPPRFLRKNYIIRTVLCVAIVLVVGATIGFFVVCLRRRFKRDEFGVEPIRYTSVRSSNLSAISHLQTNGNRLSCVTDTSVVGNGHST